VVTLGEGEFQARELLKRCREGDSCAAVGSGGLSRLVPPRQRYGYDLMVHVGLARYLTGFQREEIRVGLRESRGIELSAGTVSNLCDRFLVRLQRLHADRAPTLRAAMEGGYPLHIDATCEAGRGGLAVVLDGWRGWVLAAGRIPTEHSDHLKPIIDQAVTLFGNPIAVVRDLSDSIALAVQPLRLRGIPDLVCHFHFLGAVGKKLLERPYEILRGMLKRSAIQGDLRKLLHDLRPHQAGEGHFGEGHPREDLAALVHWLLHGEGRRDPPFPFGLPHLDFVQRCDRALEQAQVWVPQPRSSAERRALSSLETTLAGLRKQRGADETLKRLKSARQAFGDLREILRLGDADLPRGDERYRQALLPQLEARRLIEIKEALEGYRGELDRRITLEGEDSPYAVVRDYLYRYGPHLFGHPTRRDLDGRVLAIVGRTNNAIEHFFGLHKQRLRRRIGRAQLARDLQQQPAQAALVNNLRHPEYVRALCGSLENLPAALAELEGVRAPALSPLVRDHRDARLHRRVQCLLSPKGTGSSITASCHRTPGPLTRSTDGRAAPPTLEGLTEPQLRTLCGTVFAGNRDRRLPPVGGILTRDWEGAEHRVQILERGFLYQGNTYTNLNEIARLITDRKRTDGEYFFRLASQSNRWTPGSASAPRGRSPIESRIPSIRADLVSAGYGPRTVETYMLNLRSFVNYFMLPPEDLGAPEILRYLLHLVDEKKVSRARFVSMRCALRAVYKTAFRRPEAVEHIPAHLERLRAEALRAANHRETYLAALRSPAGQPLAPATVS